MIKRLFLLFILFSLVLSASISMAQEADDEFLMEDFEEIIPEFVRETPAKQEKTGDKEAKKSAEEKIPFSVKKRTYIAISYGPAAFPGGSEFDKVLKAENEYFRDTYAWTKTPFTTPITSGLTGGIEVKKGWNDNVMLGLEVHSNVGVSPEKTTKVGSNELTVSAKFDITTTFINAYFYGPMGRRTDYFIGVGIGIGSGVVSYSEDSNFGENHEVQITDKASGAQIFTGIDWHIADKFILGTKLFYRAMELRNVSLTGGGATIELVVPF